MLQITQKKAITNEPVLLVDCHHGIYIPNIFMQEINNGSYKVKNLSEISELFTDLASPENDFYWESWEDMLNNCILIDLKGNEYTLWQNDDLWAVPAGYNNEDFFNS